MEPREKEELVNSISARLVDDDLWGGRHTQHQISVFLSTRGVHDVDRQLPAWVTSRRKRVQTLLAGESDGVVLKIADELGIPHEVTHARPQTQRFWRLVVVSLGFAALLFGSIAASFWVLNRAALSEWLASSAYPGMTVAGFVGSALPGLLLSGVVFLFGRRPVSHWVNRERERGA